MFLSNCIFWFIALWPIFTDLRTLEKTWWNFWFVETERNDGNWDLRQQITFLQCQIAEIQKECWFPRFLLEDFEEKFELWRKLQNQTIWEFELDNWRMRLRGEAPQTHFSNTNLKTQIVWFCRFFKIRFFSSKSSRRNLGKKHSFWISAIWHCKNVI